METINSTNVHYIRCIKPNEAKVAWQFEPQMVLSQLRACGVLETIRISCAGYPSRLTFDELVQRFILNAQLAYLFYYTTLLMKSLLDRYYMLVHSDNWILESRKLCSLILDSSIKEQDKYQIGITKIFFRAGMVSISMQQVVAVVPKLKLCLLSVYRWHSWRNFVKIDLMSVLP